MTDRFGLISELITEPALAGRSGDVAQAVLKAESLADLPPWLLDVIIDRERRYPGQPRDEQGQFASGDGNAGGSDDTLPFVLPGNIPGTPTYHPPKPLDWRKSETYAKVSAGALPDRVPDPRDGDPVLVSLAHEVGAAGPPTIVTREEMDRIVGSGATPYFRGVGRAEYATQLRSGEYHGGLGIDGSGYYFTQSPRAAALYGEGGSVIRAVLKPDARVVGYEEARRLVYAESQVTDPYEDEADLAIAKNIGRWCLVRGYDAIDLGRDAIVVNRTALVVQVADPEYDAEMARLLTPSVPPSRSARYAEDQPRDERGRFSTSGGDTGFAEMAQQAIASALGGDVQSWRTTSRDLSDLDSERLTQAFADEAHAQGDRLLAVFPSASVSYAGGRLFRPIKTIDDALIATDWAADLRSSVNGLVRVASDNQPEAASVVEVHFDGAGVPGNWPPSAAMGTIANVEGRLPGGEFSDEWVLKASPEMDFRINVTLGMDAQIEKGVDTGWFMRGLDYAGISAHEFGHLFHASGDGLTAWKHMQDDKVASTTFGFIHAEANGVRVSQYAYKNREEQWAELFASKYVLPKDEQPPVVADGRLDRFIASLHESSRAPSRAVRYLPDQPRDDHGRWAAQGGAILDPLRAEAAKYPTFDAFSLAYQVEIKHGLYWHVTADKDFVIDPTKGPRDMSSAGTGGASTGTLMVTSDLARWLAEYPAKERPHVARIDLSAVAPEDYRAVLRGFGNEFMVSDPSKAEVVGTYSRSRAKEIDREYDAALPQSEEQLRAVWEAAHKTRSRYPGQPRDQLGQFATTEGMDDDILSNTPEVREAAKTWSQGWAPEMRRLLLTRDDPNDPFGGPFVGLGDLLDAAKALVRGVNDAEPTQYRLFRGLGMREADFVKFGQEVDVGKTIDLNLSSWTRSKDVATQFASNSFGTAIGFDEYETPLMVPHQVILRLEPGAQALDVQFDIVQGPQYTEHLSLGRYEVVAIERTYGTGQMSHDGSYQTPQDRWTRDIVTLRQVGKLDESNLLDSHARQVTPVTGKARLIPWLEKLLDARMVPPDPGTRGSGRRVVDALGNLHDDLGRFARKGGDATGPDFWYPWSEDHDWAKGHDAGDFPATAYARHVGFDASSHSASTEEMDRLIDGGAKAMYRGVDNERYLSVLHDGFYRASFGIYGSGIYTTTSRSEAAGYGSRFTQESWVARMVLAPDARVIAHADLRREMEVARVAFDAETAANDHLNDFEKKIYKVDTLDEFRASQKDPTGYQSGRDKIRDVVFANEGIYAMAHGYDAIDLSENARTSMRDHADLSPSTPYTIVLNRGALVVEEAAAHFNQIMYDALMKQSEAEKVAVADHDLSVVDGHYIVTRVIDINGMLHDALGKFAKKGIEGFFEPDYKHDPEDLLKMSLLSWTSDSEHANVRAALSGATPPAHYMPEADEATRAKLWGGRVGQYREDGGILLRAAADAPPTLRLLFRGIAPSDADMEQLRDLGKGDIIPMNLCSWSADAGAAVSYAAPSWGAPNHVVFQLLDGAHALDVPDSEDWLAAGLFRIVHATEQDASTLTIGVQQIEAFDAAAQTIGSRDAMPKSAVAGLWAWLERYLDGNALDTGKAPPVPSVPGWRAPREYVRDRLGRFAEVPDSGQAKYIDDPQKVIDEMPELPYERAAEEGDIHLNAICEIQGFNAPPERITREELDQYVAAGEVHWFRGVTAVRENGMGIVTMADDLAEQYASGGPIRQGTGWHGNGTYVAVGPGVLWHHGTDSALELAAAFADPGGVVFEGTIKAGARIIDYETLMRTPLPAGTEDPVALRWSKIPWGNDPGGESPETLLEDPGRKAAALGYDAIYAPSADRGPGSKGDMYVILNRGALRIADGLYEWTDPTLSVPVLQPSSRYPGQPRDELGQWTSGASSTEDEPGGMGHSLYRKGIYSEWGVSHGGSAAITGHSATVMGIPGYYDAAVQGTDEEHTWVPNKALERVGDGMVGAIYKDRIGAEEPIFHGFADTSGVVYKAGDTIDLPLLAASSTPDTSISYGTRWEGWGDDAKPVGTPTLFEFPRGTPMVGYSRNEREYQDDQGIWGEAVVAGRFKISGWDGVRLVGARVMYRDEGRQPGARVVVDALGNLHDDHTGQFTRKDGSWSDPGSKPSEPMPADLPTWDNERAIAWFDAKREREGKWNSEMAHGVSIGAISPREAEYRGWDPNTGGREILPLPPTLYHATMALDQVLATGLKTQDEMSEVGVGSRGLGGGTSDTISLTTSLPYAERIAETIVESHDVAIGSITKDDLLARAEDGGFRSEMERSFATIQGRDAMDLLDRGRVRGEYTTLLKSKDEMDSKYGALGWEPSPGATSVKGGDGAERYVSWERPASHEERLEATFSLYRAFLFAQGVSGGPEDPVFWAPDPKFFGAIDTTQVGVVLAATIPGSMGYYMGPAEAEWRTWSGDALRVSAVKSVASVPHRFPVVGPWVVARVVDTHGNVHDEHTGKFTHKAGIGWDPATSPVVNAIVSKRHGGEGLSAMSLGPRGEDIVTMRLASELGLLGKPTVLTADEIQAKIDSGEPEMFRGTSVQYAEDLRSGPDRLSMGMLGSGIYAVSHVEGEEYLSTAVQEAASYAWQNAGFGCVTRMTLKEGTPVVGYRQARMQMESLRDQLETERLGVPDGAERERLVARQIVETGDVGRWAMIHGYGAVIDGQYGYTLILDRKALNIQNTDFGSEAVESWASGERSVSRVVDAKGNVHDEKGLFARKDGAGDAHETFRLRALTPWPVPKSFDEAREIAKVKMNEVKDRLWEAFPNATLALDASFVAYAGSAPFDQEPWDRPGENPAYQRWADRCADIHLTLEQITDGLTRMASRFPDAAATVKAIGIADGLPGQMGTAYDQTNGDCFVAMDVRSLRTENSLSKVALAESETTGWFLPGTGNWDAVATHEFGHVLSWSMRSDVESLIESRGKVPVDLTFQWDPTAVPHSYADPSHNVTEGWYPDPQAAGGYANYTPAEWWGTHYSAAICADPSTWDADTKAVAAFINGRPTLDVSVRMAQAGVASRYREDQLRDDHGRFADEGKGSSATTEERGQVSRCL